MGVSADQAEHVVGSQYLGDFDAVGKFIRERIVAEDDDRLLIGGAFRESIFQERDILGADMAVAHFQVGTGGEADQQHSVPLESEPFGSE